jgi:hypothetical protein
MRAVGYITVVIGCLMIAVGIVMAFFEILTQIGSTRARGTRVSPGIKAIVRRVSSFSIATVGIGLAFVLVGMAMPK